MRGPKSEKAWWNKLMILKLINLSEKSGSSKFTWITEVRFQSISSLIMRLVAKISMVTREFSALSNLRTTRQLVA